MQPAAPASRPNAPIVATNIDVVAAIYFAAMLEEAKLFRVVDRLAELFTHGQLPIGHGDAAKLLASAWSAADKRLSAAERRDIYARTLGIPGGAGGSTPNREFNDLWLRFVTAVAAFDGAVSCQAARDLAINLTRAGGGLGAPIAAQLRVQVRDMVTIVSDPEIRAAFGARDMWQVIDQVAALALGGANDTRRHVTKAVAGAAIFNWLAQHASELANGHACSAGLEVADASGRWLAAASKADAGGGRPAPSA